MEKIKRIGVPLKEFARSVPLYGIKTGFNDAFLMDTPLKDVLVKADPKSASLFKRYLRGQDIDRWQAEWSGLWMLAIKSSGNHEWPWSGSGGHAEKLFRETYPALHAHLNQYREALMKRQDQGEHWWELRACAYWSLFDRPKVLYQDIAWNPRFCLDAVGTLTNNTVYFLSTEDVWALAALNAPISWWFAWRSAQHGKGEALRFFTSFMETFPIPNPTDTQRAAAEAHVRQLIELATHQQVGRKTFLDWLRLEFGVEKPSQKLQDSASLAPDALAAEVKKARGKARPLSAADVKRLKDEHTTSIIPLQTKASEALRLEQHVSEIVNAAYGLTPDDVRLLWETAPPRMPLRG
jgi:hypothetical protein